MAREIMATRKSRSQVRSGVPKENTYGEDFKEVSGYEGLYIINGSGSVFSIGRHGTRHKNGLYQLKQYESHKGYKVVHLMKNSRKQSFSVHRLVAKEFIRPPEPSEQVDHLDGNKSNNHFSNLEYVTCKENINRAWAKGLYKDRKGESNISAKLNEQKVIEIREKHLSGISEYRDWETYSR